MNEFMNDYIIVLILSDNDILRCGVISNFLYPNTKKELMSNIAVFCLGTVITDDLLEGVDSFDSMIHSLIFYVSSFDYNNVCK